MTCALSRSLNNFHSVEVEAKIKHEINNVKVLFLSTEMKTDMMGLTTEVKTLFEELVQWEQK